MQCSKKYRDLSYGALCIYTHKSTKRQPEANTIDFKRLFNNLLALQMRKQVFVGMCNKKNIYDPLAIPKKK